MDYKEKYFKYKLKYLNLKNELHGGSITWGMGGQTYPNDPSFGSEILLPREVKDKYPEATQRLIKQYESYNFLISGVRNNIKKLVAEQPALKSQNNQKELQENEAKIIELEENLAKYIRGQEAIKSKIPDYISQEKEPTCIGTGCAPQ